MYYLSGCVQDRPSGRCKDFSAAVGKVRPVATFIPARENIPDFLRWEEPIRKQITVNFLKV